MIGLPAETNDAFSKAFALDHMPVEVCQDIEEARSLQGFYSRANGREIGVSAGNGGRKTDDYRGGIIGAESCAADRLFTAVKKRLVTAVGSFG